MPHIAATDLARMRANLLFDGPERNDKLSKFWVLLVLAACIASAGIAADSTATVIGAMIVAPLMTPIMGTVLSIVTADRANLIRSVLMVAGGAAAAIVVGYLFGMIRSVDVVAATSSQVAGRVNPHLIDLLAAIATGAAGAFAQCREDVSDTLPGVAIAISLVPPLAVVGLTLEAGEGGQAWGALLLFLTNVAAILLTGIIVMTVFRVHLTEASAIEREFNRRRAVSFVVVLVAIIAIPLAAATASLTSETIQDAEVTDVARTWADDVEWEIVDVGRVGDSMQIIATGPLPLPDTAVLRAALDDAGLADVDVTARLIPEARVELPGA